MSLLRCLWDRWRGSLWTPPKRQQVYYTRVRSEMLASCVSQWCTWVLCCCLHFKTLLYLAGLVVNQVRDSLMSCHAVQCRTNHYVFGCALVICWTRKWLIRPCLTRCTCRTWHAYDRLQCVCVDVCVYIYIYNTCVYVYIYICVFTYLYIYHMYI